jgi:eukaryotic-like serine/threonine-protein kinase
MWRALAAVLAIAVAVVAVPAVRHLREQPPAPPAVVRAALSAPDGAEFGAADVALDAAISPDGRVAAFVATKDGRVQLWRRGLDSDRAEPLAGTEGAAMPAWKRGGGVIAFFADGVLKQIALADGSVRVLASAPNPAGAAWLGDGSLLFTPDTRGPIKTLRNASISDATQLAPGDLGHAFPLDAGDGAIIYTALRTDGTRVLRYSRGSDRFDLETTSSHAELAGNVLVHVRDGVLLAQRLDRERHVLTGRTVALVASVGVSATGRGFFTASPRLVLAAAAAETTRELTWVDPRGQTLGPLAEPGAYWQVRLSPDDRHAAVTALDPLLRTLDVFALPLTTAGRPERISLSLGADTDPVWSPDATRVTFRTLQRGAAGVSMRTVGRSEPEEVLLRSDAGETPSDWRGRQLLFHAPSASGALDVWMLDLRDATRTQVTRGGFNEWDARWSPDGRWITYASDESGHADVYVDAWPDGGRLTRVSTAGGIRPHWSADGTAIVFMRGNELRRAVRATDGSRGTADRIEFRIPETVVVADGLIDFDVAHSSARFAILTGAYRATRSVTTLLDWNQTPAP